MRGCFDCGAECESVFCSDKCRIDTRRRVRSRRRGADKLKGRVGVVAYFCKKCGNKTIACDKDNPRVKKELCVKCSGGMLEYNRWMRGNMY